MRHSINEKPPTWICEHFFGSGNVNKLLFSGLLGHFVLLKVIGMPLLSHFPIQNK